MNAEMCVRFAAPLSSSEAQSFIYPALASGHPVRLDVVIVRLDKPVLVLNVILGDTALNANQSRSEAEYDVNRKAVLKFWILLEQGHGLVEDGFKFGLVRVGWLHGHPTLLRARSVRFAPIIIRYIAQQALRILKVNHCVAFIIRYVVPMAAAVRPLTAGIATGLGGGSARREGLVTGNALDRLSLR
jgi:hypothetical protein